uniref:Uncharacterized protein n=1 Tax=Cacopsylla melanoneura TaxID=428564 RepID=A0A8D8PRF1_9HEMI
MRLNQNLSIIVMLIFLFSACEIFLFSGFCLSKMCLFLLFLFIEEDIKAKRAKPDPEYYRDLGKNRDPERAERKRKTPNRGGSGGTVVAPEVKVEAPDGHYQYSPAGPSSVSPYHQHSRTPSPSYNPSYQTPLVYAQPFSPDQRQNVVYGAHQSNIYSPAPAGTPHGPDQLFPPISPHNNPVFVPNQHPPDPPGACGGSSFAELIPMDTRGPFSQSRQPGDSLNDLDSNDLLPQLSRDLSENLNISISNQNMTDSLTKIANEEFDKFQS